MPIPLEELLAAARKASRSAYCPYSKFHVGAAVWAGGRIHTGANVENASYGLTICAERTAAFAAILAGAGPIEAVAVACVDAPEGSDQSLLMPCGACRQVLAEFDGRDAGRIGTAVLLLSLIRLCGVALSLQGRSPYPPREDLLTGRSPDGRAAPFGR